MVRTCVVVSEERPRTSLLSSFAALFSPLGLASHAISASFGCRVVSTLSYVSKVKLTQYQKRGWADMYGFSCVFAQSEYEYVEGGFIVSLFPIGFPPTKCFNELTLSTRKWGGQNVWLLLSFCTKQVWIRGRWIHSFLVPNWLPTH